MTRFEFLWSIFLVAALVAISWSAEFLIPEPKLTPRVDFGLREAGSPLAEYTAAAVSQAASLPYAEEVRRPSLIPIRNAAVAPLTLEAKAALALDLTNNEILFEKNIDEPLPIASLTKLMTALVAREIIPAGSVLAVSKNAVSTEGAAGGLWVGETLTIEKLLYFLLLPSSNDAAVAIAENIGLDKFTAAMNEKARTLGLRKTLFRNPSGLDAPAPNISSAAELSVLAREVWQEEFLMKVVGTQTINLASEDGKFQHHIVNSNKLLGVIPGIIGGKTGYTEDAGQAMLLLIDLPAGLTRHANEGVRIVTIVLSSPDRLAESRKLVEWLYEAYEW